MIHGRTKYSSLIEGDLDNHQTEIDFFGSVMKNLTFDLKPNKGVQAKIKLILGF